MSVLSSRRYLSVWLRRLSTDRVERRASAPAETFVIAAPIKGAQCITALTDSAARLGLKTGMGLADARAMYPKLPVVEADFEADRHMLEAIADWCDRYTPLVGLDSPDGLLLDITGCAHLFGGETALARDLVARLTQQGFHARVAVADTVGCAWGVARYGKPGIVPRGETGVAALPIAALRVDAETVAALKTSGLTCVADLDSRPRAPFAARFGKGLLLRLDQALGRVDEPITPRLPVPAAMAEQRFPDPIAREDDVLGTIEHLGQQLATVLDRRGEGGRLFQVALFRADGAVHRLEIGTGAPLRDPAHVRKLFEERLAVLGDACDPGFGYDMVRLSALVAERSDPAQTGLGGNDNAEELAHLIDRLGAHFGLRRITRMVSQDTHIPEHAVTAVPAHAPRSAAISMLPIEQDSLSVARPLRLFERPEPVDAIAQVPDGPPIRFTWRHVTHQVTQVVNASPWNGGATSTVRS
jgi:protein ImuB